MFDVGFCTFDIGNQKAHILKTRGKVTYFCLELCLVYHKPLGESDRINRQDYGHIPRILSHSRHFSRFNLFFFAGAGFSCLAQKNRSNSAKYRPARSH